MTRLVLMSISSVYTNSQVHRILFLPELGRVSNRWMYHNECKIFNIRIWGYRRRVQFSSLFCSPWLTFLIADFAIKTFTLTWHVPHEFFDTLGIQFRRGTVNTLWNFPSNGDQSWCMYNIFMSLHKPGCPSSHKLISHE